MTDIQIGSLELENSKIDLDDVDEAYEEGQDQEAEKIETPTGEPGAAPPPVPAL